MKTNMLILIIPSMVVFILICIHMAKTKGLRFMITFVLSGLLFGFIRARIINIIQTDINNSFIPYEFSGKLLRIGNDSVVVYIGWIIVAYLAWQLSEIIIERHFKKSSSNIFQITSISFFIIAALSYANETAASVAGWWNWNEFLTANFSRGVFINVPWVGLVDWGTVAFEFLAIFLLFSSAIKTKKWSYLSLILVPIIHWSSHINGPSLELGNLLLTPSLITHYLLPIFALILWKLNGPKPVYTAKRNMDYLIYIAIGIITTICALAEIFYGHDLFLLISIIPIAIFIYFSLIKNKNIIYVFGLIVLLFAAIIFSARQQIWAAASLFPILYLSIIDILNSALYKINSKKYVSFVFRLLIIMVLLALSIYITKVSINSAVRQSGANVNGSSKQTILITLDTVPASHFGSYGYTLNTTKNFDIFAKENILYQNAYSPIPYTYPAHLSILSGLYPKNTGVINNTLKNQNSQDIDLISEIFKDSGYRTAAFIGSNVLNSAEIRNGFDVFDIGDIKAAANKEGLGTIDQRPATETNEAFLDWLSKNNNEKVFAWVHYYDPHSPYRNDCDAPNFTKDSKPDNKNLLDGDITDLEKTPEALTANDLEYLSLKYDQDLYCTDAALGELIEGLKQQGVYENSDIIIVGDHGENFDHNSISHGDNLYQSAIKIPLAIKSSSLKINKSNVTENISLIDIYPTLLEISGLTKNVNQKLDGVKLTSEVRKNRPIYFQTTAFETPKTQTESNITASAVVESYRKLINNHLNNGLESYDIATDPNELNPLNTFNDLLVKLNTFYK